MLPTQLKRARRVVGRTLLTGVMLFGASFVNAKPRQDSVTNDPNPRRMTVFAGTDSSGCTHWASFGSSAGYFTYKCCGGSCSET